LGGLLCANGAIDILVEEPGEKVAVEIETGKSDIKKNLNKIRVASSLGPVYIHPDSTGRS
jgi:predicted RecB family endonuclease